MKSSIKTCKTIDVIGQILMVIGPLVYFASTKDFGQSYSNDSGLGFKQFIITLYIIGGWQTLSFLIHLTALRAHWIAGGRKLYNVLYLVLICAGLITLATSKQNNGDGLFIMLFALGAIGPIMGIIYFLVSIAELKKINRMNLMDDDIEV